MENKLEKVIIDPIVPFFVYDKWHEKIELYQLTYNHKTYSYHYLKDFFHLSVHDAEDALKKLQIFLEEKFFLDAIKTEHFLQDLPHSIAFFARGIFSHQSPQKMPFLLTNQELVHYKNLNLSSFQSKRLKIKMDESGISELFDREENFRPLLDDKIELVLDFNQTLKAIDVHHLKKIIDHHPLKSQILYLEDPLKAHDYHHLNKEELKLIGLDESLHQVALHDKHLLENIPWMVIKPSLYSFQFIHDLLQKGKNISISASYESPSIYRAFLPLIEQSKKNIHGLSTFNIYPDEFKKPYIEHLASMSSDEFLIL